MRYFVTGATGFLGGEVTHQLVAAGHDVVALARTPKTADLPDDVEVMRGDITVKESMREPMTGVDGVFHLAGWYRVGTDPSHAEAINVGGTRNTLELVAELDVPKAVYTSTLAVNSDTRGVLADENYRFYGRHLTAYDRTKWRAHREVAEPMMADGLPLVVVMPGLVYGPGDESDLRGLWVRYLERNLPAIPRVSAYCWGHVEDIARAHRQAMVCGTPGEEYIVCGEPHTLVEAFEVTERVTGIDAPRVVSPAWFRGLSRVADGVERVVDLPAAYAAESLRVLGGVTYLGDNTKAMRELGLAHRPFEEGLGETVKWEREQMGE